MIRKLAASRWLSILTVLALVFTMVQFALVNSGVAHAEEKVSGENNPRVHAVVGDLEGAQPGGHKDPWPADFPRETDPNRERSATNNRIALVFDFHPTYTWETLGGCLPLKDYVKGIAADNCTPNKDQAETIIKNVTRLKGLPVSFGVYTSDIYSTPDGLPYARGNTPNLPSTSVETEAGYQKVVEKLRSLDATLGTGNRYTNTGNAGMSRLDLSLQLLMEENDRLPADQKYTDVIIFSTGINYGRLDRNNNGEWRENTGAWWSASRRTEALFNGIENYDGGMEYRGSAEKPAKPGTTHIHVMGMGWEYGNNNRQRGLRTYMNNAGTGTTNTIFCNEGSENACRNNKDAANENRLYEINHLRAGFKWDDRDATDNNGRYRYRGEFYQPANISRNDVKNGKFARNVTELLFRSNSLIVTNDVVDDELRYAHPHASIPVEITTTNASGGDAKTTTITSGTDGILDMDLRDRKLSTIIPAKQEDKILTRIKGTDGGMYNARCQGYSLSAESYEDDPSETFYPRNIDDPQTGEPLGAQITRDQAMNYHHIKCNFYHRDLEPTSIEKTVNIEEPGLIRREVVGYTYDFDWSCKDPFGADPNKVLAQGYAQRTVPDVNLNIALPKIPLVNDKDYSKGSKNNKNTPADAEAARLPAGTKCTINEKSTPPAPKQTGGDNPHDWMNPKRLGELFKETTTWGPHTHGRTVLDTDKQKLNTNTLVQETSVDATVVTDRGAGEGINPTTPRAPQSKQPTVFDSLSNIAGRPVTLKVTLDPGNFKEVTGKDVPATIPVYYSCRYTPSRTAPLELKDTQTEYYPGGMGKGAIQVPTNGDPVTLPEPGKSPWNVGADCEFSMAPDQGFDYRDANGNTIEPLTLDGFDLQTVLTSDSCKENSDATSQSPYPVCKNPTAYAETEGEKHVHILTKVERGTGSLTVTKETTGDAAYEGNQSPFDMKISCTGVNGENVPVTTEDAPNGEFQIRNGEHKTIKGLPTQAECQLTEKPKNIDYVKETHQDVSFKLERASDSKRVTSTTDFTYLTASIELWHKNTYEYVEHPDKLEGIYTEDEVESFKNSRRQMVVNCYTSAGKPLNVPPIPFVPGEYGEPGVEQKIADLEFPHGTTCTIRPQVLDPVEGQKVTTTTDTVMLVGGQHGHIYAETHFADVPGNEISVNSERTFINVEDKLQELVSPELLITDINCGSGPISDITVTANGGSADITGVPTRRDDCSAMIQTADGTPFVPEGMEAEYTWTYVGAMDGGKPRHITWTNEDLRNSPGGLKVRFNAPDLNKSSASDEEKFPKMVITSVYKVVETEVSIAPVTAYDLEDGADQVMGPNDKATLAHNWRDAFFQGDQGGTNLNFAITCTHPDQIVSRRYFPSITRNGVNDPADRSKDYKLNLPVGWNCDVGSKAYDVENPLDGDDVKIPGSDGMNPSITMQNPDPNRFDPEASKQALAHFVPSLTGSNQLNLHTGYKMQLAAFNVKKNVDGDGVALVPGNHEFGANISCTLNGAPIKITDELKAQGTDAEGRPNMTFTDGTAADSQRLTLTRFQQGEWHQLRGLPAGAKCTLNEDTNTIGFADVSEWTTRFDVTGGFRGRDKAISDCNNSGPELCKADRSQRGVATVTLPTGKPAQDGTDTSQTKDLSDPAVPKVVPANFLGTLKLWNGYEFKKAKIEVGVEATGNGAQQAENRPFNYRLYCKPPLIRDASGNVDEAAMGVTNLGINNRAFSIEAGTNALSDVSVPVGYKCLLAQKNYGQVDGELVTTAQSQPSRPGGGQFNLLDGTDDNLRAVFEEDVDRDSNVKKLDGESHMWVFTVNKEVTNIDGTSVAPIKVTQTFNRPLANLTVVNSVDDTFQDAEWTRDTNLLNIGKNLKDQGKLNDGYLVKYACTDPYSTTKNEDKLTARTITGEFDLPVGGSVNLGDKNIPATASCDFTWSDKGADPLAGVEGTNLLGRGTLSAQTGTDANGAPTWEEKKSAWSPQLLPTPGDNPAQGRTILEMKNVPMKATKVDGSQADLQLHLRGTYMMQLEQLSMATFPQGARAQDIFTKDTSLAWQYQCAVPEAAAGLVAVPDSVRSGTFQGEEHQQFVAKRDKDGNKVKVEAGTDENGNTIYEDDVEEQTVQGNINYLQYLSVPVNTKCTFALKSLPDKVNEQITANGFQQVWAGVNSDEVSITGPQGLIDDPTFDDDTRNALGTTLTNSDGTTEKVIATFELSAEKGGKNFEAVLVTVYKDKGTVYLRKVNADANGNEIPTGDGSNQPRQLFKLYPALQTESATENPAIDMSNDVENRKVQPDYDNPIELTQLENGKWVYSADLAPGQSYFLVEEDSGVGERMPQIWRVDVEPVSTGGHTTAENFGNDVEIKLSKYTEHSGLVTVGKIPAKNGEVQKNDVLTAVKAGAETQGAWTIDVANISSGALPFTGGYLPWVLAFGVLLILGAAGAALNEKRKEK